VFFIATFIGKAVNKVLIQTGFIIMAFSKHLVSGALAWLDQVWPSASKLLTDSIEIQKAALFADKNEAEDKPKSIIKEVWDWVIMLMVLYFVVSFLNSIVRNGLKEQQKHSKVF
jgi:hypothetical protein